MLSIEKTNFLYSCSENHEKVMADTAKAFTEHGRWRDEPVAVVNAAAACMYVVVVSSTRADRSGSSRLVIVYLVLRAPGEGLVNAGSDVHNLFTNAANKTARVLPERRQPQLLAFGRARTNL